jgi:hypothetical protein
MGFRAGRLERCAECYNPLMDTNPDIKFYRDRWKAVEEIERQELRALPIEGHWKQLNSIVRLGRGLGFRQEGDDGEMQVFLRWARLKGKA